MWCAVSQLEVIGSYFLKRENRTVIVTSVRYVGILVIYLQYNLKETTGEYNLGMCNLKKTILYNTTRNSFAVLR